MAPFTEHEQAENMNAVPNPTPPEHVLLQAALAALQATTELAGRPIGPDAATAPTLAPVA